MRIAIIGSGNVGQALGTAWQKAGHEVFYGLRDTSASAQRKLRQAIGERPRLGSVAEAAAFGDVVVLATPWSQNQPAIQSAGDLHGKLLIDCTNPLTPDASGLAIGFNTSAAEQVANWAKGASVFKAFNSVGSGVMREPAVDGRRAVMFFCGDDAERKPIVQQLVGEVGFEPVDAGALAAARLLEPLAMLWIHLALRQGLGADFAFGLLRREAALRH